MDETEREGLSQEIREVLAPDEAVAAAYLYGSTARAATTPLSDVDVALVPVEGLSAGRRGELVRRTIKGLERRLRGSRVEVRLLDELPTSIRGRVVTEGVLVYESDPVARVRAEVHAGMLYHDFLPFELRGTEEGLAGLRRSFRSG